MHGQLMSVAFASTLDLSFEGECPVDHAFSVWTTDIGIWWPSDHTVSGAPSAVVIDGRVGGRIFERARDGVEHDWGVVTAWDPPLASAISLSTAASRWPPTDTADYGSGSSSAFVARRSRIQHQPDVHPGPP